MGDVVNLPCITRLDIPSERVIEALDETEFESVVIVGHTKDGDEYFASSLADGGDTLWLLERAKLKLLRMADEEED